MGPSKLINSYHSIGFVIKQILILCIPKFRAQSEQLLLQINEPEGYERFEYARNMAFHKHFHTFCDTFFFFYSKSNLQHIAIRITFCHFARSSASRKNNKLFTIVRDILLKYSRSKIWCINMRYYVTNAKTMRIIKYFSFELYFKL